MEGDDFLWECAFTRTVKDRLWIIPDKEELNLHYEVSSNSFPSRLKEYPIEGLSKEPSSVKALKNHLQRRYVSVKVMEERGEGILDIIGGEVWEAALLLSSYIYLNRDLYLDSQESINILELGCGVALPSFLLANLHLQRTLDNKSNTISDLRLVLSDYEADLLINLDRIVTKSYSIKSAKAKDEDLTDEDGFGELPIVEQEAQPATPANLRLAVAALDWANFSSDSVERPGVSSLPETMKHGYFDFLYGSALCYAPYHGQCLADVVE
jgi:hypothetical protein